MLCLPGFGTHANTQNLPHFRAFPASIQEHSPPKCLFFMANAKLSNRPGFALLLVPLWLPGSPWNRQDQDTFSGISEQTRAPFWEFPRKPGHFLCDPDCPVYRPQIGPPARNGEKMAGKWILAPPGKRVKKWLKNGKIGPKIHCLPIFGPIFPFFGHFFPFFPVGPKSIFRPFFPHFGPEARFGVRTGQSGSQHFLENFGSRKIWTSVIHS